MEPAVKRAPARWGLRVTPEALIVQRGGKNMFSAPAETVLRKLVETLPDKIVGKVLTEWKLGIRRELDRP